MAGLLITGEVLATAHCADQNGGWQTAECTLLFELTIDCPEGADAEFDIRCRALAPTAEPMQDADGEYRALEWGVTISVEGKIYRAYALDCCTDGYSTRYQSACKGRTLQTVELVNLCRETETRRETLPLPEATGEVVAPLGQGGGLHRRPRRGRPAGGGPPGPDPADQNGGWGVLQL